MSENKDLAQEDVFKKENFDILDLQDEIRVDHLCRSLLEFFYLHMVEEWKYSPEKASALAYGADYFLREYVIPDRQENIFSLPSGRVRQFAANWYIVRTLEPNMVELTSILQGVDAFYIYGRQVGKISEELRESVTKECADLAYYRQRIESFWAIENDGYFAWEKECTLEK
jgi:hypothetical protein